MKLGLLSFLALVSTLTLQAQSTWHYKLPFFCPHSNQSLPEGKLTCEAPPGGAAAPMPTQGTNAADIVTQLMALSLDFTVTAVGKSEIIIGCRDGKCDKTNEMALEGFITKWLARPAAETLPTPAPTPTPKPASAPADFDLPPVCVPGTLLGRKPDSDKPC